MHAWFAPVRALRCGCVHGDAWAAAAQPSGAPRMPSMSGAALLVLLAGWPLAVLALLPVAAVTALWGPLGWTGGLERLVWSGLVPATLTLAVGWVVRRGLPRHLFAYLLGRGYVGTLLASALAGAASLAIRPGPPGVAVSDLLVARLLLALAEAFLTGALTATLVACRPEWVATYSNRLYPPSLPPRPRVGPGAHRARRSGDLCRQRWNGDRPERRAEEIR